MAGFHHCCFIEIFRMGVSGPRHDQSTISSVHPLRVFHSGDPLLSRQAQSCGKKVLVMLSACAQMENKEASC